MEYGEAYCFLLFQRNSLSSSERIHKFPLLNLLRLSITVEMERKSFPKSHFQLILKFNKETAMNSFISKTNITPFFFKQAQNNFSLPVEAIYLLLVRKNSLQYNLRPYMTVQSCFTAVQFFDTNLLTHLIKKKS